MESEHSFFIITSQNKIFV